MLAYASVGRVSATALALALGVGAALMTGLGVAHADPSENAAVPPAARSGGAAGPEPIGSAKGSRPGQSGASAIPRTRKTGLPPRLEAAPERTATSPVIPVRHPAIPYANWTAEEKLFTGRSSILSNIVAATIPLFHGSTGDGLFTAVPPWYATIGVSTSQGSSYDMPVWTLQPAIPSGKQVIAIHGGGYVNEPSLLHWLTYSRMAAVTGATVVVPMYPLVPQGGTAVRVVPQMTDFLVDMVGQYGSAAVSVLGDSAGGGLALAATQEMIRRGEVTPAHLVLLLPWLDITLSDPAVSLIDDPIASPVLGELINVAPSWSAGLAVTDPWVSPLYGSLDGLPAVTVYSGSRDLTAPDTLRLRTLAIEAHADISFVLRAGALHDWPLYAPLPDAVVAIRSVYLALGITGPPVSPRTDRF